MLRTYSLSILLGFGLLSPLRGQGDNLLGELSRSAIEAEAPYALWFAAEYQKYTPDAATLAQLQSAGIQNYDLTLYLGTWCSDSRREVPRIYKILDKVNYPSERVRLIGVDDTKALGKYKQEPTGAAKGAFIHHVPVLVVAKDGKEISRLIEAPKESLERDLYAMLRASYTPYYSLIDEMEVQMKKGVPSLSALPKWKKQYGKRIKKSTYEGRSNTLSSYGYTLLYAGRAHEARFIFHLNQKLFPRQARVYLDLARANTQHSTEAIRYCQKALKLDQNLSAAKQELDKHLAN